MNSVSRSRYVRHHCSPLTIDHKRFDKTRLCCLFKSKYKYYAYVKYKYTKFTMFMNVFCGRWVEPSYFTPDWVLIKLLKRRMCTRFYVLVFMLTEVASQKCKINSLKGCFQMFYSQSLKKKCYRLQLQP